jgi:hypothetical protein
MGPLLVWGLFPRLLGLVALVAIVPLWGQVLQHCGSRSACPVAARLRRLRQDFPLPVLLLHMPTLLLLCVADWFLKALVAAGALAALLAVYGGPFSHWALLACFVVLLSLDRAMHLMFPWDCLLMESLALAALLPAIEPLPGLQALAEPLPIQAFAFDMLIVRLMLGFGKMRFVGATKRDGTYLREFAINQPLPSPAGWYLHHFPSWVHRAGLVLLFFAEILLPLLAVVPGPIRLLTAAATVALMAAIWLMGTFGYFNLIVIVLCLPLLDPGASIFAFRWHQVSSSLAALAIHLGIAVLAVGWAVHFLFNSWCFRSWPYWPVWANRRLRLAAPLIALCRWLVDLRLVHAYGVFPAAGMPAVKFTPVVQGSLDGQEWRDYEHWLAPTNEASPPRFIAPLHSRWDQFVIYLGYGMDMGGLTETTFNSSGPLDYSRHSPVPRLIERLLEGEPLALKMFRGDPFHGRAPRYIRQVSTVLKPLSIAEHRRTGLWWERHFVGVEWPAATLNPRIWDEWLPTPELYHWDHVIWRRRSYVGRRLEQAGRLEDPLKAEAAVAAALELPLSVLERYWSEFIPTAAPPSSNAPDWTGLEASIEAVNRRFSREQFLEFERVTAGLAIALAARHEHRSLGDHFGLPSYLQAGMLMHHVIQQGRDLYCQAWADEAVPHSQAACMTDSSGLWLWTLFRPENMRHHAYSAKIVAQFVPAAWNPIMPGAIQLVPFFLRQFPADRPQDSYRVTRDLADGAWHLDFD